MTQLEDTESIEPKQKSNYDYTLKFIVIGSAAVGKTQLVYRYIKGKFDTNYAVTMGVEFGHKVVQHNNKTYNLQIWDTAGSEVFDAVCRGFYSGSTCGLVCFDIIKKESFDKVQKWINDCRNYNSPKMKLILVGNKADLEDQRQVSKEEARIFAEKNEMDYFETSSLTGVGVEEVFLEAVKDIDLKIDEGFYEDDHFGLIKSGKLLGSETESHVLTDENSNNKDPKKKGCC